MSENRKGDMWEVLEIVFRIALEMHNEGVSKQTAATQQNRKPTVEMQRK